MDKIKMIVVESIGYFISLEEIARRTLQKFPVYEYTSKMDFERWKEKRRFIKNGFVNHKKNGFVNQRKKCAYCFRIKCGCGGLDT